MSRVLIADHHAVVRTGYRLFLKAEPSIDEIGEASSGNEMLEVVRRHKWDLLMMDMHMFDRNGWDLLKHVRMGYPDLLVLVISELPEEIYARRALRAGASGYLLKSATAQEMLKAVRRILGGRRYVSAALAESMAAGLEYAKDRQQPLHVTLSTREFQILCQLAEGKSVSAIGEELSLSIKTISTYRTRLLLKMGMSSNADITAYALRNGLIQ